MTKLELMSLPLMRNYGHVGMSSPSLNYPLMHKLWFWTLLILDILFLGGLCGTPPQSPRPAGWFLTPPVRLLVENH